MSHEHEVEMEPEPESRSDGTRRLAVIVGGLLVVALAVVVIVVLASGGSDDDAIPDPTGPEVVSDRDEVVTDIAQSGSLALVVEDGTWFVENDGNVTMSDVGVRGGSEVLCELGTIAPGDRAACSEAGASGDLVAFGLTPQGDEVTVESG